MCFKIDITLSNTTRRHKTHTWYVYTFVMAKDVAHIIFDLAKNDKNLDGLHLKQLFMKKSQIDANNTCKALKKLVTEYMKSNLQPVMCTLKLDNDQIKGGQFSKYIVKPTIYGQPDTILDKDIYTFKDGGSYRIITNKHTKHLIKNAILPLNLKWTGKFQYHCTYAIVVTWDHWDPEKINNI